MAYAKATLPEGFKFPYNNTEWAYYHTGMYGDKSPTVDLAIQKMIDRVDRITPNIKKSSKVLFLSSGVGAAALYVAVKQQCKVECICPTKENAERTQALFEQFECNEKKVNVTTCKLDQIPFSGQSFDLVISMDALTRTAEKQTVLREVARLLVPEGRFVFTDTLAGAKLDEDNEQDVLDFSGFRDITSGDNYLKMADKADLERVYVKENPDRLIEHYQKVKEDIVSNKADFVKESSAKNYDASIEKLDKLIDAAEKELLSWGLFQFQKRNV